MSEATHPDQLDDRYPGEIYSFDEYPEVSAPKNVLLGDHPSEAGHLSNLSYGERSERLRGALVELRDMIDADPTSSELAQAAYVVGRTLADVQLLGGKNSEATKDLFDKVSRTYDYTTATFVDGLDGIVAGTQDFDPNSGEGVITIADSITQPSVEVLRNFNAVVKARHPHDFALLHLISVAAHEAGHAFLADTSTFMRGKVDDWQEYYKATAAYMSKHPEKGFVGDWTNDVKNREEQFAEGYGRLALSEAIALLGYDGYEINDVMTAMHAAQAVAGPRGESAVDYMPAREGVRSPRQFETIEPRPTIPDYNGILGYGNPLTKRELKDQIHEMATVVQNGEPVRGVNPYWWKDDVLASQPERKERGRIKDMQKQRTRVLHPEIAAQRKKRINQVSNVLAGMSVVGNVVIGAEIVHAVTPADSDVHQAIDKVIKTGPGQKVHEGIIGAVDAIHDFKKAHRADIDEDEGNN